MPQSEHSGKFILYAPNIHAGGGLVLFQEFLDVAGPICDYIFIAERAKEKVSFPKNANVQFVEKSFFSRLLSEWKLKKISTSADTVLCFHGLPPLFTTGGKIIVFLQNRLIIENTSLQHYHWETKLRIQCERLWVRIKHHPSIRYIVQTPSMASILKQALGHSCTLKIVPFAAKKNPGKIYNVNDQKIVQDFIYVANGDVHKNHVNLIGAWKILAEGGAYPSLALTISSHEFPDLLSWIKNEAHKCNLNIVNHGILSTDELNKLYASSKALIYPSIQESFGLPLVEALQLELPIIASELDFVRDIVDPMESFDPSSPLSIARAVQRFMNIPSGLIELRSARVFFEEILK